MSSALLPLLSLPSFHLIENMLLLPVVCFGGGNGAPLQYSCLEEPGRLQSMGSLRVGHDWGTSLSLFTFMHWRRKWQPLQCSCLENPRDGGARWAAVYGVAQSQTRLKWLSSILFPSLGLHSYALTHDEKNTLEVGKERDIMTHYCHS